MAPAVGRSAGTSGDYPARASKKNCRSATRLARSFNLFFKLTQPKCSFPIGKFFKWDFVGLSNGSGHLK